MQKEIIEKRDEILKGNNALNMGLEQDFIHCQFILDHKDEYVKWCNDHNVKCAKEDALAIEISTKESVEIMEGLKNKPDEKSKGSSYLSDLLEILMGD